MFLPNGLPVSIDPLAYGFDALLSNEFSSKTIPCVGVNLVPSGPGYTDTTHQACAGVGGARVGEVVVWAMTTSRHCRITLAMSGGTSASSGLVLFLNDFHRRAPPISGQKHRPPLLEHTLAGKGSMKL